MSSPVADPAAANYVEEDDPMQGSGDENERGAAGNAGGNVSDDSSEEPEEDEEEERRIREGFIVDEDEDEDEDDEEEERRRRRKRRKKHHRRHRDEEDEGLEEDDIELLEENTGASFSRNRLIRLRRARDSESPPAPPSSKRKAAVELSDDDLDNNDLELPGLHDIQKIWDDERNGASRDDDDDMDDDMDNFIDYEDEEEGEEGGTMDEEAREERRRERRRQEKARRRALGRAVDPGGIDANTWDELQEVFGDGHEYDWALVDDEEVVYEETQKSEMKYQDVFEPSEIRARMLTEDDDIIRGTDIPERMQLATSALSASSTMSLNKPLTENDLDDAASWVITRLGPRKERDFFRGDGQFHRFLPDLVQAITFSLRFLFVQQLEVPYVWTHKRDYISYFNPAELNAQVELLSLEELWRVYTLGHKYCSLLERRHVLDSLYGRLGASNEYFENEVRKRIEAVEMVADATEWLSMKHRDSKKSGFELHFHDDEEQVDAKKHKTPSRISPYELAKKSIVSKLAEGYGIQPHQVVLNFMSNAHTHFVEDPELNPHAYAEQFADPDASRAQPAEELLSRARMILATELGKDPLLRHKIREVFKNDAVVSVLPTERGIAKIDEFHPFFNFKYMNSKPAIDMLHSAQFLHILQAESQHLVTVSISLPAEAKSAFERGLNDAFASDSFSDNARAWNEERSRVVQETLEQHLIPIGVKWAREWIREEAEDFLADQCSQILRERVDAAPYATEDMAPGETPSVLAMSWGKGEPHKDLISLVFMDEAGRLREHTRLENLVDQELRDEFVDILKRRRPHVIVIGGFSIATAKLAQRVKEIVNKPNGENGEMGQDESMNIDVIYVLDEVARMYQNSKRAEEEYSALTPLARYCVGLARYTQSPLNEYAALGADIKAIMFDEDNQNLIPAEKLLSALERVLVDVTNKVGVDVNRAVTDSYYQFLLPFVCGLGPRKAQVLVKKIASLGGNLVNREQFIKNGLLTTKVFLNAAGFLRIIQDAELKSTKGRRNEDVDVADPLDNTRIHPEDYELARKMATDALELDEEDIHDEHPSHVVSLIMEDADADKKLDELNLDDFAVNMYETNQDKKRHTLNVIRAELVRPFGEQRDKFIRPTPPEVIMMLTGETMRTLRVGLIVSVLVVRVKPSFVAVRLDSGIDGMITSQFISDDHVSDATTVLKKGQTLQGVIIDVKLNLNSDSFWVELSSRPSDVSQGDSQYRRVRHDEHWNHQQYDRDLELQARKKRAEVDRTRRVIKHPNFHNFNAQQAEQYLEQQQRGDVVIRPSSKGVDHLAVTWKVDDRLFQHIDVVEPNADPTGQTVGTKLIVDAEHQYSDLDEMIVNHVQAMARKVEELMAHEKFKHGSEDDLHIFLKNYVAANPAKSAYGFTLNRKRPGHFNLCFLANKNSTVQTWPVRVTPEAYYLFDTPATGVSELCDAFKIRHIHESGRTGGGLGGGKTPYGAGGRTPARTPAAGHATPGHTSVRQIGRTPNPYGQSGQVPGASSLGASTPAYGAPPRTPYGGGYQTPIPNPPGVHPARAALIQQGDTGGGGGWGQGGW